MVTPRAMLSASPWTLSRKNPAGEDALLGAAELVVADGLVAYLFELGDYQFLCSARGLAPEQLDLDFERTGIAPRAVGGIYRSGKLLAFNKPPVEPARLPAREKSL